MPSVLTLIAFLLREEKGGLLKNLNLQMGAYWRGGLLEHLP